MQKLSMEQMKYEMVTLTHLNQIIDDFIGIMKAELLNGLDPNYFTVVCRDFIKLIDDSPYITNAMKSLLADFLINKVKKDGVMTDQGNELQKFVDFLSTQISNLRQGIMANMRPDQG